MSGAGDDALRERVRGRMAAEGIPVGSDVPAVQALGAPPLHLLDDDACSSPAEMRDSDGRLLLVIECQRRRAHAGGHAYDLALVTNSMATAHTLYWSETIHAF